MTIDETEKIKTVVENKDYVVKLVNAVARTMIEAFENLKIEDVNMFQLGYNKAIDDFSKLLRETRDNRTLRVNCDDLEIKHMTEQLKAGGNNESKGISSSGQQNR